MAKQCVGFMVCSLHGVSLKFALVERCVRKSAPSEPGV